MVSCGSMSTIPYVIDANSITEFQTCRRKFLLSKQWRPQRWIPKILADSCLRQAIVELSQGEKKLNDIILDATTRFMTTAANSGLDIQAHDPYTIATDWCGCLETILHALSRRNLPKLKDHPSILLEKETEWVFLSHLGDDGYLHRWITVGEKFDGDRLAQEAHSWRVFGDIAAARLPMKLHAIEIGQMRDGRRHSPWTRAYTHTVIRGGKIRFNRKGNKKLQGDAWKPVYLADSDAYDSKAWVDVMEEEDVISTLIHEVELLVPDNHHLKEFKRHVRTEAEQMSQWSKMEVNPRHIPMSRGACDTPFPCQFQACCFSPDIDVDIASLGIYKPRKVGNG